MANYKSINIQEFKQYISIHHIIHPYLIAFTLSMNKIALIIVCLYFFSLGTAQTASYGDFLYEASQTSSVLYNSLIGVVFYYPEIAPYLQSSTFYRYMLNSNVRGNWACNWAPTIRMPKGYHYNCSMMTTQSASSTDAVCIKQFQGDAMFFANIGQYIWNTTAQPFWTYGINNEYLNWWSSDMLGKMFQYLLQIYEATHSILYHSENMYQGDKMVENGLRQGSYTLDDMLLQAYQWEEAVYGIIYKGPGVSQDAPIQWIKSMDAFYQQVWIGVFTIEAVIFEDPALVTIENLLSDNYTKAYFVRRFSQGEELLFSSFNSKLSFSCVRLVQGDGIDGVTNTFAAVIWHVDFVLESVMYDIYDISFESKMNSGNFQSILKDNLEPQALYYSMIFVSMLIHDYPTIVLPKVRPGSSGKIKIWGLQTVFHFNVVVLNKDPDPNLNSSVEITIKSSDNEKMQCFYLEAPSLNSKADQITIGGHQYQNNNASLTGQYKRFYLDYNEESSTYTIPIKYAQIAFCSITHPNLVIPIEDSCWQGYRPINFAFLLLLALLIAIQ